MAFKDLFAPFLEFATDVTARAATKAAGSNLGKQVIQTALKDAMKDDETKEKTAAAIAAELAEAKTAIKEKGEHYLQDAAHSMGTTNEPVWRQIYNNISSDGDNFLIKPIKGLFSMLLSGGVSIVSFLTAKFANKLTGAQGAEEIKGGTVKNVFTGLMKQAFRPLKANP